MSQHLSHFFFNSKFLGEKLLCKYATKAKLLDYK